MTGASLRVFEIRLPTIGALQVWRDFTEQAFFPYRLECGGATWLMSLSDAASLGYSAVRAGNRFRGAARRGDTIRLGSVFRRDDDTGTFIAEIGIVDDTTMYVQLFEFSRVELQGEQVEKFLAALLRLDADVRSIPGGFGGGLASRLAR